MPGPSQVPQARLRRDGQIAEIDSTGLVPGDVALEVYDPCLDGRRASLEVQEAALTGESAPVAKGVAALTEAEVPLGDRTNLLFQNTQVTRGSASFVVTETGSATQMGHIAGMVSATERKKSPLQVELDGMTKIFGLLAWATVTVIAVVGILRGQPLKTPALLCVSTAIAPVPVGLPTFVQHAVVGANLPQQGDEVLADVETGGTTVINSDKTGTLTMNQMTATSMLAGGDWYPSPAAATTVSARC
jgi:Ca2+-transporting ATPase